DTPSQDVTMKEVRSLWLHLGLYDVLQVLFSWVDKFIMSLVLIASLSAIYYNGAMNIPFLPLILSAAGSAILIQLASVNKEDELTETLRLLNQSARMLSCIVFPLFLFLLFFRYELFGVLLSDKYLASVPVFLVSILVLPLRAYSFTTILQNQHKGAIINIGAILDIVLACLLIYPLYRWLGLPGVALAFVITTYLQAAYYMYHTARVLQVKLPALLPYKNWLFKLIIFAITFITIHYLLVQLFKPAGVLISGAVLSGIIVLISLWIELKAYRRKYGKALS
ncbi:MAG: lipopolysaccharide biosynthesis protein, partial [Flavipsychrobacter sp.]